MWIKKKYESFGLAKKILIVIIVVSIIPIFLVELFTYTVGVSTMKNQTKELIVSNLKQSGNSLENFFNGYVKIIRNIYTDNTYAQQLRLINIWDGKEYYTAKNEILNKLRDLCYVNDDILGIAIVANNGEVLYHDTYTLSTKKSFFFDNRITYKSDLVLQAMRTKETEYSETYYKSDSEYGESRYFYIAHQLIDFNAYKEGAIGCIVLAVSEQALRDVYYQENNIGSNISIVVNQKGDIISLPITKYIGQNIYRVIGSHEGDMAFSTALEKFFIQEHIMENRRLEINIQNILDNKFILANVQDVGYALKDVNNIIRTIILADLLVVVGCSVLSIFFTRSTNEKVHRITYAMKKADTGDYTVRIYMEGNDEFAQISSSFNQMLEKINHSMIQEREAMIREKNAEIRSLEAQINPHFLYNTLDVINWVALDQEAFTLSKMITNLAVMLRYSIQKSNEIVSLRTELEYLKQYIHLQQRRTKYSFQCLLDVEEELLEYKVHKLLLQPLIENTIEHGFSGENKENEILIRIQEESSNLVFIIQANGCGMTADKVALFNHYDYKKDKMEGSIGIRNVITRIKLYYGDKSEFHIESSEKGTKIRFMIPGGHYENNYS